MKNVEQRIITVKEDYSVVEELLAGYGSEQRVLLVCGNSAKALGIYKVVIQHFEKIVEFGDFTPNPEYEQVLKGVDVLHENECKLIITIGGGSAMDVAKSIKMMADMDRSRSYFEQQVVPADYELIAIPTTAGSGAESTHFAVIYDQGIKKSIEHRQILPNIVILDATVLKTLSIHQRKSTMLDAMSHCIESFWSVHSTEESKAVAIRALRIILENASGYIANEAEANANMLCGANQAGQAIAMTKTTAGHAMCYTLTKKYGITHGMAAALCTAFLYGFTLENTNRCLDERGEKYLTDTLGQLANCFGISDISNSHNMIIDFLDTVGIDRKLSAAMDLELLVNGVNIDRLNNNPVKLDKTDIENIYKKVFEYLEQK